MASTVLASLASASGRSVGMIASWTWTRTSNPASGGYDPPDNHSAISCPTAAAFATSSGDILEDLGYSRSSILYRMRYLPLPGQFRKTYAYSNFGYTTAAIAAAIEDRKALGNDYRGTTVLPPGYDFHEFASFSDYENRPNKAALNIFSLTASRSIVSCAKPMRKRRQEASVPAPA